MSARTVQTAARYVALLLASLLMAYAVSLQTHYRQPWAHDVVFLALALAVVPAAIGLVTRWRKAGGIALTAVFLVVFAVIMALPLWDRHHGGRDFHRHSWFGTRHQH